MKITVKRKGSLWIVKRKGHSDELRSSKVELLKYLARILPVVMLTGCLSPRKEPPLPPLTAAQQEQVAFERYRAELFKIWRAQADGPQKEHVPPPRTYRPHPVEGLPK